MKNRRRVMGIGAAVVLAGLGAAGLVGWAHGTRADAEDQQSLVPVVIVDKQVPQGADAATIAAATHQGTVQLKYRQSGALTSEAQIGNQVAAATLEPGDQLVAARLAAKVENAVPADKVQISTQLTPERAVGGILKPGDTVGVYLSFDPFDTNVQDPPPGTPTKTPNTTHLEFQHVLVTNVQTTTEPVLDDKDSTDAKMEQITAGQYIVTLALTPAQSERFVFATEFGHVWLANEPATVSEDGTALVTLGNVYTVVK
jgi:pilus assembly protein CpaB